MRRTLALIGILFGVHVVLLFVRPPWGSLADSGAWRSSGTGPRVGIVFDVGGRGDKSFNDGAWRGAERAARELGARVRYIEPGEPSDREAGLRLLASEGLDLVIGVGFVFSDDITALAREYPGQSFADIDFTVPMDSLGSPLPIPNNLLALRFRDEEGAFLVGALAALSGGSEKIGFIGGMDIPLIHRFEAGYRAGVQYVCSSCEVIAQYAGVTPDAFRNPGRGKELALSQYQQGVNVIFHAAGATGLGVFEAARAANRLAIGVDADQYNEAPGHILTSMIKGIDEAVFQAIEAVANRNFTGGVRQLGLAEHGVGFVYDDNNRALIADSVKSRIDALSSQIIAGRIRVPTTR